MAQSLRAIWQQIMKHRFLKTGLPFIVLVAGGSFFLKEFAAIRYQFRQGVKLSKDEAEKLGLHSVSLEQLEKELVKEMEQMDVNNWENIRGPRPWEDSKSMQEEQRENLKKQKLDNK